MAPQAKGVSLYTTRPQHSFDASSLDRFLSVIDLIALFLGTRVRVRVKLRF
jgi:hypothetical protein